jgi:hypothetical protein
MLFHVVAVRSSYISAPIRAIHAKFFHGKARRGGEFPSSTNARLAHDVDLPLRLHKNAFKIADVFAPELELVVSRSVSAKLSSMESLRMTPVYFDLLYTYPYEAGDLSCGFDTYTDQMRFIDDQFDDPRLHSQVDHFFHVETPPIRDVRARNPEASVAAIQIDDEQEELPISPAVFAQSPVYSFGGSFVMCDSVFRILAPFIDNNYYLVASYDS